MEVISNEVLPGTGMRLMVIRHDVEEGTILKTLTVNSRGTETTSESCVLIPAEPKAVSKKGGKG